MTPRVPPRLATWLVRHLGPDYRRESLAGDLFEEYQQDRTRGWYWRQTAAAVVIGSARLLRVKFVFARLLRLLIELGIVVGGIALAQSKAVCATPLRECHHTAPAPSADPTSELTR